VTRILIVSHEQLGEKMSGPSIRNWELARVLSSRHQVTLAVPGETTRSHPGFAVTPYTARNLGDLVRDHDVVQCYGFTLNENRVLLEAPHMVVDLYGPFVLESLHIHEELEEKERYDLSRLQRAVLTQLMMAGDFFLCASERQKDYYLGWLDASGRINPQNHGRDPAFESLIKVVPFGLPDVPPVPGPPRLRGVLPGVDRDSFVVVWGGGIWNWFDPLTLIEAAARTRDSLPQLRVYFPASASPSEQVPAMRMAADARRLSDRLGLTGNRIFFGDSWVPYDERGALLLEADLGISLHRHDVETRFSFRTRVLDYLWAGLPVVTTEGDSMADLVQKEQLGAVVRYGDVDSLVEALTGLAGDPERRSAAAARARQVASRFRWSVVAEPLLQFCDAPQQAADRRYMRAHLAGRHLFDPRLEGPAELGRLLRRTAQTLRRDGAGRLVEKVRIYYRRRFFSTRL
jgi:glycosyltransferase involved in cell wall biosynthesis